LDILGSGTTTCKWVAFSKDGNTSSSIPGAMLNCKVCPAASVTLVVGSFLSGRHAYSFAADCRVK
jgi:hypothetical protein